MKPRKSFQSDRKRPSSRSPAPTAKGRDGEGNRDKKFFFKGGKSKKDGPSFGSDQKPAQKSRFGDKAKPTFRADQKPRFGDKDKRSFRSDSKPRFGDSDKPDFRSGDKPRFGEKRRFGKQEKFVGKERPAFRSEEKERPVFRKPRSEQREETKFTPNGVLIWGLHAARAAFLNPKRRVTRLWLSEAGQKLFEATQKEAHDELLKRPDPKRSEKEELNKLLPAGSVHQGIVIETAALADHTLHDIIGVNPPPPLLLMLDQVTDPHNVGAILRSAAAFGAGAVIMTERNAPTTTGVLAKSASGALEHVPMIHVVNLARALDELREAGYWCVGLAEEGARNLGELDLSGRTVLVLGAEGEGLRHLTRQKCDELARLPTGGPIGSLNVSNAAAVALYEVRRQAK